eukprot:SAG22_NODE_1929_length_3293_cov_3.309956_5_plen_62_part_00
MNDVAADQGCTSVVRGSHRLDSGVGPAALYDLKAAGFPQGQFAGSGVGRTEADGCAPLGEL